MLTHVLMDLIVHFRRIRCRECDGRLWISRDLICRLRRIPALFARFPIILVA